jgi:RNA polymerase sigma-70 factor (ECF subfamily)
MTQEEITNIVSLKIISRKNDFYRIALSFCKNNEDAMDAISEMTIVACEKYNKLKNKEAFDGWCSTILINCCRKYIRQRKKTISINEMENDISGTDMNSELSIDLQKALLSIKPIYREVVILKELIGFTYDESAKMLHSPIGTVKSRRNKGIEKLRKLLGGYLNEN